MGRRLTGAPISDQIKRELLGMREADRKPFSTHRFQPKEHGDAASRHLDSVTLEQHLMDTYRLSRETVRTYLSPISGGGSGLGGRAFRLLRVCGLTFAALGLQQGAQMFPGRNTGVARHILKQLIPTAISGGASMLRSARRCSV